MTTGGLGELVALSEISARIGARFDLVQGPGGNTSQKIGDRLWIKGSGLWLADAANQDIFVPIDLPRARAAVEAGASDLTPFVDGPSSMRPSIETAMHALLAHAVVVHVHSINTLAWAVRSDGRSAIAPKLQGLHWAWVDYVRPGPDLAVALRRLLAVDPTVNVIVLGNHGLLVAADGVDDAWSLLESVEQRLNVPARSCAPASSDDLDSFARVADCRLPARPETHVLAMDPLAMQLASEGAMYPDHAVFLGGRIPIVSTGEPASTEALVRALASPPYCAIVPGRGVLLGSRCTAAAEAMIGCCALLAMRLREDDAVSRLPLDEIDGLRSWDLEQFRQQRDAPPCKS